MRCGDFEERLNAVLDERERPEFDPLLRRHAEQCLDCRELLAVYGDMVRGLARVPSPSPPPGMAWRVVNELQPSPGLAAPRQRRRLVSWLATAAALLIAAFAMSPSDHRQLGSIAGIPPREKTVEQSASPLFSTNLLDSLSSDVTPSFMSALADLNPSNESSSRAGSSLADMMSQLPGMDAMQRMPMNRVVLDRPAMDRPRYAADSSTALDPSFWTLRLTEELRPLTEPVGQALNTLLDALPPSPGNASS